MDSVDVIVIGAGAAGLFCAGVAGQLGLRVRVLDHATKLAEKIRISGGGRCNFTNLQTGPQHFLSENPHFCRSALARYTPLDFVALLDRAHIGYHEKHKGQLFCDDSSQQIIDLLLRECVAGNVSLHHPCTVAGIERTAGGFTLQTTEGAMHAANVVVATGGLSIPKIGASDFGHRLARQFGVAIVPPRPALVPLTFAGEDWQPFVGLAGLSVPVNVACGDVRKGGGQFREDLLFTHRGLSGPAILQISSYWQPGQPLRIDLLPDVVLADALIALKSQARQHVNNLLAQWLPTRLADALAEHAGLLGRPLADTSDRSLRALGALVNQWQLTPTGSEGFKKAEVTRGGVDTRALDSRTMMAKAVPGLYFIGEVVDVTGWLGGYNFQWAWASGHACAQAMAAGTPHESA
jgi:predicted Rossmann fold flavoprotein